MLNFILPTSIFVPCHRLPRRALIRGCKQSNVKVLSITIFISDTILGLVLGGYGVISAIVYLALNCFHFVCSWCHLLFCLARQSKFVNSWVQRCLENYHTFAIIAENIFFNLLYIIKYSIGKMYLYFLFFWSSMSDYIQSLERLSSHILVLYFAFVMVLIEIAHKTILCSVQLLQFFHDLCCMGSHSIFKLVLNICLWCCRYSIMVLHHCQKLLILL